jgi:hypothetical protein
MGRSRNPSAKRLAIVRRPGRDRRSRLQRDSSALQERAEDFFGFEELAGDFSDGQGMAGVIGVDLFHGFGDLAEEIRQDSQDSQDGTNRVPLRMHRKRLTTIPHRNRYSGRVVRLTDGKRIDRMCEMASAGFTYWQDQEVWLGYLDEYPDYMTQGTSLDDLKEHLLDLFKELSSGNIPNVRQHSELELA